MKPVRQKIMDPVKGDCFAACLASLMGFELEWVPNFCAEHEPEKWFEEACQWMNERGHYLILFPIPDWPTYREWLRISGAGYWIACGTSPRFRGKLHSVLYKGDQPAHDPHPDDKFLAGDPVDGILVVNIDPEIGNG